MDTTAAQFGDLARALKAGQNERALSLCERLLQRHPESQSLRRTAEQCRAALRLRDAECALNSRLVRVNLALCAEQDRAYCEAVVQPLADLGFAIVLDAMAVAFDTRPDRPCLLRFFSEPAGDALILLLAGHNGRYALRWLVCASACADGRLLLTQRDEGLRPEGDSRVLIERVPAAASLTALVTRHAGRLAALRREGAVLRELAEPRDCDALFQQLAAD